jgi:hypothetical protein
MPDPTCPQVRTTSVGGSVSSQAFSRALAITAIPAYGVSPLTVQSFFEPWKPMPRWSKWTSPESHSTLIVRIPKAAEERPHESAVK